MNLLERGLMLWQCQKNSSPVNPLKVTFMGEAGVDPGALRKEFLTGQDHYIFHNSQINMKVIHKVSSVFSPFEWWKCFLSLKMVQQDCLNKFYSIIYLEMIAGIENRLVCTTNYYILEMMVSGILWIHCIRRWRSWLWMWSLEYHLFESFQSYCAH